MTPVRLELAAPRSRVKHSATEPLRSPYMVLLRVNASLNVFIIFPQFVTFSLIFMNIQIKQNKKYHLQI